MSMKMLTILQFISALSVYTLMTVLLPALIFYRKFRGERLSVRFFFYLTIGNFYLMNLVFFLQLLHISNRFTLILGTVAPALYAGVKVNHISVRLLISGAINNIFKISRGTLGTRLLRKNKLRNMRKTVAGFGKRVLHSLRNSLFEWILFIGLIAFLLWVYGTNMLETYGFCVSDIPVHHYWINNMGQNNIFVAGVYPFGFHCIIYYLHTVFGIETYVLLRVFGIVQMFYIHIVLLAFLKAFFRTRYTAYLAVFVFAGASFYNIYTYQRYYSALPQEFGMVFILPSIYFLLAFLKDRKKEVDLEKALRAKSSWPETAELPEDAELTRNAWPEAETDTTEKTKNTEKTKEKIKFHVKAIFEKIRNQEWSHSTRYLAGFAMCFSMTLAVHFYDTMIAGLFCLGIAAGYALRIFRREYFGRVMLTGIISILLAVLPMGVAFATGTPLQGSLNWGMEVISGEQQLEETPELDEEPATEENTQPENDENIRNTETGNSSEAGNPNGTGGTGDTSSKVTFGDRLKGLKNQMRYVGFITWAQFEKYVMPETDPLLRAFVFAMPAGLLLLGIIFLFAKKRDYGATLLSVTFFMLLMTVLFSSQELSIPELMDKNRSAIYLSYMLPVAFGFLADGILWALLGWTKKKMIWNGTSLLLTGGLIGALVWTDQIKQPEILIPLESNEAITCLTNILRDNKNWTFTICSANDELRMMEDYGYHYETITFLKDMENKKSDEMLILPTERVYFFIEKTPLDYDLPYEGSGQKISREGAAQPLPSGGGLSVYQAKNRWIVMSKMYYWAKEFQDLYKNEMRVYYETDDFICYEVKQNPYRLYDFSIDYGYNTAVE